MSKYLYLACNTVDPLCKQHRFFKIGQSKNPIQRMQSLRSSGSVDLFQCVFQFKLPAHVTDAKVLAHPLLQPYVLCRPSNKKLQTKFAHVWGAASLSGSKHRRELVMFGQSTPLRTIKKMLKLIIRQLNRPTFVVLPLTDGTLGVGKVLCTSLRGKMCVQWYGNNSNQATLQPGVVFEPGWTTPTYLKPYYATVPKTDVHVPYYISRDQMQVYTHSTSIQFLRLTADGRIPEQTRQRLMREFLCTK
jgi:hypothetical protein